MIAMTRLKQFNRTRLVPAALVAVGTLAGLAPRSLPAQWSRVYDQFYMQAPHNWVFRSHYAHADRLFNAFDYGHAILYETLWRRPGGDAALLEETQFTVLTRRVLVNPPRLPLEEAAIQILYARLAPEAKGMFEWAHLLHRQLYDVLADERLSAEQKDREAARLMAYYRSRPDMAFSARPKSMALMQEQTYSLAFRQKYPKFNGLIWGYHWLQVGLYEPLLVGRTVDERQTGVRATVARFWQMIGDAPSRMPSQMPMTAVVSPVFAARYPEAAIVFDNLHSMHDVVSDILTNPDVPRDRKRAEILRAARLYTDDTSYVMTVPAWLVMSRHMGVDNMGGPAVGFLPDLPSPTVTRGAVMQHDDSGAMTGFAFGGANGDAHAGHVMSDMPVMPAIPVAPVRHEGHAEHDRSMAPSAAEPAGTKDSAAVDSLVGAFYHALEEGDSATLLQLLTPDAVILESGQLRTLNEYRTEHLPADVARSRARKATRAARRISVRGNLAYSTGTSTSTGQIDGRPINSAGAELIVATRSGSGWRISAVHWSSHQR